MGRAAKPGWGLAPLARRCYTGRGYHGLRSLKLGSHATTRCHKALGGDLAMHALCRLGMIYSQVLQRLKKRAFDERTTIVEWHSQPIPGRPSLMLGV